jgi:hypothetical protein
MYNVSYVKQLLEHGYPGIPSWQSQISNHEELFGDSLVYNCSTDEYIEWNKLTILARKSIQANRKMLALEQEFENVP